MLCSHGRPRRCKLRSIQRLIGLSLACVLTTGGLVNGESRTPIGNEKYDDANANLFLDSELTFITITMAPADLQAMIDNPYSDDYKLCSVHFVNSRIDEVVSDVAIRPRGNTSRSAIKKSWKLKFNEFVPGREFHGVEKLNLNGEHNDPSIIRSKLSWDLLRAMGVAASRANHVHVTINDGSIVEGVFISVEQVDDEFVDAWFGNSEGNLYKCLYKGDRADLRYVSPGLPQTYQNLGGGETYQEENNEEDPDYSDLAEFIAFINNTDSAAFAAGIVERFSVDNFLRAMAADVVIGQWDNYWYGANNYYLFHNEDTGRFEYIPYDYDNTYGVDFLGIDWATRPWDTWGNGGYGSSGGQLPPLIQRILDIPAYEAQYRRYLQQAIGATEGGSSPAVTEYTDTVGDLYAGLGPHYDIVSVKLSNDATNLYIDLQLNGPVNAGGDTGNGEYVFLFNTRTGGSTSNPWGRLINATVLHDFFMGSWPDGGGGTLLYERTGGSWSQRGSVSIDLSSAAGGLICYSIPLSKLEVEEDDVFTFDVASTGGGSDPGYDHLSNPNMATPNGSTPSTPGPYLSYTVREATLSGGGDGPFTLSQVEAKIDAIKAMIDPYAFQGSYSNGNMDWTYDADDFDDSYTLPTSYRNWDWGWDWGLKPFISTRTSYLLSAVPAPAALPALYINEMLADNNGINADEMGQFEDWVEIHNAGETAVDLGGMYLTDDPAQPKAWQFPAGTTVAAGGFLLVWCDDDPTDGPLHATFKLAKEGEGVGLFHDDDHGTVLIDYASFPAVGVNVSYGRYPDGAEDFGFMTTVTPGAANAGHNTPPLFENTARAPTGPTSLDTVWITSRVTDADGTIASVTLTYDAGAGSQAVGMFDDGGHHDGAASDKVYGSSIPPHAPGTSVTYYLTATDDDGAVYHDPAEAPGETYAYVIGYAPPPLFINEYMADNDGMIEDPDEPGEYADWFEIYNAGDAAVDLAGMYLTDKLDNPTKYLVPSSVIVPAGGLVIFWADEDSGQGPTHTNFKLSASGESIGLFDSLAMGNQQIDAVTFGAQATDVSEGRFGDGMECIRIQAIATPGATNLPVYGDQDDDGVVNGLDITIFVDTLLAETPDPPAIEHADLNCDNVADELDLPAFLGALLN